MPPKRAAAATTIETTTRTSRKRAADDDSATPSESKRPRRAAATHTPVKKQVQAARSTRSATAPKPVAKRVAPVPRKKPIPAPALKKKAVPARKVVKKPVEKPVEEPKPKVPRVPKPKPPPFNALIAIPPPRENSLHAFVFGNGDAGQFGLGTEVTAEIGRPKIHTWFENAIEEGKFGGKGVGLESLVAGGMHSLAITPDGRVWSWGVNDEGALGRQVTDVPNPDKPGETLDREELESSPAAIESLEKERFRAVALAAGDNVSVAIGEDGLLKAWGCFNADNGKLGFQVDTKADKIQTTPTTVPFLEKIQFSAIATGSNHVVGLTVDGKVYTWGAGEQGQLGRKIMGRRMLNSTRPDLLHLSKIVTIGSGDYHSFAVDAEGNVYGWGLNQYAQLGLEITTNAQGEKEPIVWSPTIISELSPDELGNDARVVEISGGEHHTLFLLSDGRVFACGRSDSGQVGLAADHPAMKEAKEADLDYVVTPSRVFFPPLPTKDEPNPDVPAFSAEAENTVENPIVKIAGGGRGNLVISKEGHAYSWGYGASCQLGLGADVEEQPTPSRVRWKGADDWFVENVSAGGQHCFLLASQRNFVKPDDAMDESA